MMDSRASKRREPSVSDQYGMKRLCVFCGSSPGRNPAYVAAAVELGNFLARREVGIVYGGAAIGLMGTVADAARAAGGEVIGVIPRALVDLEVAHVGLADLRIVASMHERKALMAELSDGFIALPGGIGTLEELFEVWTWGQLGSHLKPCALLNIGGFYDRLLGFLDFVVDEAFLRPVHRSMLLVGETPSDVFEKLASYQAPPETQWVSRDDR